VLLAVEQAASVAGALDEPVHRDGGQPQQVVVGETELAAYAGAVHPQPPGGAVDRWGGGVVADEEPAIGVRYPCPRIASQRISALVPRSANSDSGVGFTMGVS